jgi:hypothetical protein
VARAGNAERGMKNRRSAKRIKRDREGKKKRNGEVFQGSLKKSERADEEVPRERGPRPPFFARMTERVWEDTRLNDERT